MGMPSLGLMQIFSHQSTVGQLNILSEFYLWLSSNVSTSNIHWNFFIFFGTSMVICSSKSLFFFFLLDASPIAFLSPVELGVGPVKRFGQTDGADRPGS